jgi:hypothetical protein
MNYLFDNLPLDVIQYVMYPYLDYNSKVILNCMLPPQDRIRTPLKSGVGLSVIIKILAVRLSRKLIGFDGLTPIGRARKFLNLIRNFDTYHLILQHCKRARESVMDVLRDFSNPASERYGSSSKYVRTTCSLLSLAQIEKIEKDVPYISEFQEIKCCDHWSAISSEKHKIIRGALGVANIPIIYEQTKTCFRLPGIHKWDEENYSH